MGRAGVEGNSGGHIRQFAETARARVAALPGAPKRVVDSVFTAWGTHTELVGKRVEARRNVESSLSRLGTDGGVNLTQIVSLLGALGEVVKLEESDLSPTQIVKFLKSNILTTPGKTNTASLFREMGKDIEEDANKRRIRRDPVRRAELLRKAGALSDAADYLDPATKVSSE